MQSFNTPTLRSFAAAYAFTLLAISSIFTLASSASAGTLSGAYSTWNGVSTTTNPPKITAVGQTIQVKYLMGVAYYGPDKNSNFTCWAKLEYSDGTAPEMVPIKYPMDSVGRMKQYTKPDKYTATLTGMAHNGAVGCLGNASTSMTIEDGLAPSPKKAKANQAGAVMPQVAGQAQQGQQSINTKPKLTTITLVKNEFSPGVVDLIANVQSNGPSESCHFKINVLTNNPGNDTVNLQLIGTVDNFALPSAAKKISLGMLPVGKYRLDIGADIYASAACVGSASADFEVKRFKMNIAANITGVKISDDGYEKTNKIWIVGVEGQSATPCGYVIRLKNEATGKTIENTGISTLPLSQAISFDQEPTPGQYLATVSPWAPVPVSDVPACMGSKSASAHHSGPKLGALNLMSIDYSSVSVTTPMGQNSFDGDSALGSLFMPTAISMNVTFKNQDSADQKCAYTLTVSKGGVQKAVAYNSGQALDVLAAIMQGPGWGTGEYLIAVHASPTNSGSVAPSCLGKRTHKLTLVDGGAIASGINSLTHKHECKPTWDSNSALSGSEKQYCEVLISAKITGAACNYTIQVQEPGKAPTYYPRVHYVEGGDFIGFEYYRGKYDQATTDAFSAKRYVIRVAASPQDKASGSGCAGEYYNASVPLFLN